MKILLKVPLSPYSGYGNDGIALSKAMIAWGIDVYLQPTHVDAPLPENVSLLLTKHLEAPFDLIIVHVDPANIEATAGMNAASEMVVGWTMWEWDKLFFNEKDAKAPFGDRISNFDALIAYDDNTRGALSEYTSDMPVAVVQGGYDPEEWPYVRRNWHSDAFRFCMQGALHERKGVFYAIEAFKELKDEFPDEFGPAELHLKTVSGGLHPAMSEWCPGLYLYHEVWPRAILQEFYSRMHVMLCPSRGEGKNLPALQFLSSGAPVIATNWGGHTQWLSHDYAYALDYELEFNSQLGASNATPDKAHLKALMMHTFRNRRECREKGEMGARTIPLMCSWDSVLMRLFDRLAQVHPQGQIVRDAAMQCRQDQETDHLEKRTKSLLGSM